MSLRARLRRDHETLNSVLGLGALSFFVPSCFLHGLPWDTTRICPRPAQKDDEEQQKGAYEAGQTSECLSTRQAVHSWFLRRELRPEEQGFDRLLAFDRDCARPPCNPTCSNRRSPRRCERSNPSGRRLFDSRLKRLKPKKAKGEKSLI